MGSLTSVEKSIILGSTLGDGTLRIQRGKRNALLEINHSIKAELYLRWKYQNLKSLVTNPPKVRQSNGSRYAIRFTTQSLPELTEFYHRFYHHGHKKIPRNLRLDPLALAVWFMDDGSKSRSAYYLNTQQFEIPDQLYLIRLLSQQHGVSATLNRDKSYYRIRIRTSSAEQWRLIVEPFVIPWMVYKLTNDPVTTDSKEETLLIQALLESNTPNPALKNHAMANAYGG